MKERKVLSYILLLSILIGGFLFLWQRDFIEDRFQLFFTNSEIRELPKLEYEPQTSHEEKVIEVINDSLESVVSILIYNEITEYETYYEKEIQMGGLLEIEVPKFRESGTKRTRTGSGSGFVVTRDGLILTNKHVVLDEEAEYVVVDNMGNEYDAEVLALDPFQDLAIIRADINLEPLRLGNSDFIKLGQSVIAIGNALGEFENSVSVGIVSGLSRRVTATGEGFLENLEDVIQTDAAINHGNSGGPLINLKGEVIGINVAIADNAESIGFSIPINKAKRDIRQVEKIGEIVYPFLGVRYIIIDNEIQEELELSVNYGAIILEGENGENPIFPDSSADKAGLKNEDIILSVDEIDITEKDSLSYLIQKKLPGDMVKLEVQRDEEIIFFNIELGQKSSNEK